jgi:hypothetical protein
MEYTGPPVFIGSTKTGDWMGIQDTWGFDRTVNSSSETGKKLADGNLRQGVVHIREVLFDRRHE